MSPSYSPIASVRQRGVLPPSAPLPAAIQTAACRLRPLEYLTWCRRNIGPQFTVDPVDMPPLVFLCDPEDIRAVLTAPLTVLHAGVGAAITAPIFGDGSFLLRDEGEYVRIRDAIQPALNQRVVEEHAEIVSDFAVQEVSSWPIDHPLRTHPKLCRLTLRIMLRLVFGREDAAIHALQEQLLRMLSVASSLVIQEPRLRHMPGWRRTWLSFAKDRDAADRLIAHLLHERKTGAASQREILDLLLQIRRPDGSSMSNSELRDNLVSVIVAGYETTASTLAWALQLLAYRPDVQDRLVDDITDGDGSYLTATINEVIRHRPVFLFAAPRAVVRPIEIGAWTFHPPVHLLGCTYLMHHDPTLFPDPHRFRPERFLDAHPRGSWLPWGGGRKTCPGRHVALLELRTILAMIVRNRTLAPARHRLERPRWRSALVTPHAGSQIVLRARRADGRFNSDDFWSTHDALGQLRQS
jgi:cytochrome P450 family 135